MHIPDGYLGPTTCGFFYAVMLPIWITASRVLKKTLKAKQVPLLAMGAAFSFVLMMFNVPIPGGSTGHAIGGVLLSILLGPWQACISITVTLVVQAFLFADGGIMTLGANAFNLAFASVFSGYYIYRVISFKAAIGSNRRVIASGIAAYIGINISAFLTGVEFGLQPALYSPYGLKVAIPAMLGGHLLVFGWIEGLVTALVIKYLQKQDKTLFYENQY